jgi:hypothetical protein
MNEGNVISIVTRELIQPACDYPLAEFARRRDRMIAEFRAWVATGPDENQVAAQIQYTTEAMHELAMVYFFHGGAL